MINQGNSTWTEDSNMMKYATSCLLTDADGDSYSNEYMISRVFCYPQRNGPELDPNYPELGKFSKVMMTEFVVLVLSVQLLFINSTRAAV